jgi:hypothetical protein
MSGPPGVPTAEETLQEMRVRKFIAENPRRPFTGVPETQTVLPEGTGTPNEEAPAAAVAREEAKTSSIRSHSRVFPLDLETYDGHPWINFEFQKYKGVKFNTSNLNRGGTQSKLDSTLAAGEDTIGWLKGVAGKAMREIAGFTEGVQGPATPEATALGASLDVGLDTIEEMSAPQVQIAGNVRLYLPIQLQETYSLKWTEADINQGGALVQTGMDALKDLLEQAPDIGREVAGRLAARGFGTPALTDLLLRNADGGAAVNNHLEAFFKGVDFRKFSYNFQFFPKSPREAAEVALIVRLFKAAAAPELRNSAETYGRYWVYPNQFKIEYWNPKETHNIGLCYLTNITVNYGAAGTNQSFVDRYPLQTDMTLNFTEMEVVHKDQIINRGY